MSEPSPNPPRLKRSDPAYGEFCRPYASKHGEEFILEPADIEDFPAVLEMYDTFEPKEAAQGLPPSNAELRKAWVQKMLDESINVIARIDDKVAGHACLIDMIPGERAELEIMVHHTWRNLGFGSAMLKLLIEVARHLNYQRIWLAVDVKNTIAVHVYKNHGFKLISPFDIEIEFELKLYE